MKVSDLEKMMLAHIQSDKEFQDKMNRVLFGSEEEQEIGIVEMIKTMYGFFTAPSKLRTVFLAIIGMVGVLGAIKGWWLSIISLLK